MSAGDLQVIGAEVIGVDEPVGITERGVSMRERGIAPSGSGLFTSEEITRQPSAEDSLTQSEAPAGMCRACGSRRVSGVRSAELCPSCLDAKEAEQARLVRLKGAFQRWPRSAAEVESRKQNLAPSSGLEWKAGNSPGLLVAHPTTSCALCSTPAAALVTVLSAGASEFIAA